MAMVMAAAEPAATPAERKSSARRAALTALAIIAAAALGVLVATLLSSLSKNSSGAPLGSTPATGSSQQASAPTASPSQTTGATTQANKTTQSTKANEALLKDYYSLLPKNKDKAWSMLSQNLQNNSGGRSGFDNFWNTIADVKINGLGSTDPNTVTYRLKFERKDGRESRENWRARVVSQDGKLLIDTANLVSLSNNDDGNN